MKVRAKDNMVLRLNDQGEEVLIAEASNKDMAELIVKAINLWERSYAPSQTESNFSEKNC
jgi:hypothetical protein